MSNGIEKDTYLKADSETRDGIMFDLQQGTHDAVQTLVETVGNINTDVEINKSSISRIWWWLGGISLSIIAAAVVVIRNGVH